MIHDDTIQLLRECDAGVKMGISSIDSVLDEINNSKLKEILSTSKCEHEKIEKKIQTFLNQYHDDGKEPSMIAKGMSFVGTNMKLMMDDSDSKIADIMIDGCDMGAKSLSKYLNKYEAASEDAKTIAKELIALEEKLSKELRIYL